MNLLIAILILTVAFFAAPLIISVDEPAAETKTEIRIAEMNHYDTPDVKIVSADTGYSPP